MVSNPILWLVGTLVEIYTIIIIVDVILSWLIGFQVVNYNNQFVRSVRHLTTQLTEPAYRRIRRVIPPIGGLDLSPLVLLIGIQFLRQLIFWLWYNIF